MLFSSSIKKSLLSLVTTLTVSLCAYAAPAAKSSVPAAPAPAPKSTTALAPDFTLKSLTGSNVRLSEQRGKVVMLNFWASWCGPCRQEMPLLDDIYKKYQKMGFVLLGINVEEDDTEAKKMLKKMGVTFPILFDSGNKLSVVYNIDAMPTSIMVDKKGKVRYVYRGYTPGDEKKYVEQIQELIRE